MKKVDYIRFCRTYCKKYDTSYHVEFLSNMNEDLEKPTDKKEVCKNCIYVDAEFMTGCNYPYIVE